jgi:hypothetical protein
MDAIIRMKRPGDRNVSSKYQLPVLVHLIVNAYVGSIADPFYPDDVGYTFLRNISTRRHIQEYGILLSTNQCWILQPRSLYPYPPIYCILE